MLQIAWWNWDDDTLMERAEDFTLDAPAFAEKYYAQAYKEWGSMRLYDICKLSPNGVKTFLFYPDCDEIHPIYDKVIRRFAARYHAFDAELVLYLPEETSRYDEKYQMLMDSLAPFQDYDCYVNICNKQPEQEAAIFHSVGYFITTRARANLQRVEWAERCKVRCIAGVDPQCFEEL